MVQPGEFLFLFFWLDCVLFGFLQVVVSFELNSKIVKTFYGKKEQ